MLKQFTVFGVYEDTGQAFHEHATATDHHEAMRFVARDMGSDTLCFIGAVEGEHVLLTAGNDNGYAIYTQDLIGQESEAHNG